MTLLAARFPNLKAYLSSDARGPDALNFEQLLGFLYAVSSAPDAVDATEWLPFVFRDPAAQAASTVTQRAVMEALDLHHAINCQVFSVDVELPQDCKPRQDVLSNLDPECGLSLWSQGFSVGHDWLEDAWEFSVQEEVDEELDWQLGGCMAVLCFFSSREMAQALHDEFRTDARDLEERARVMLELLPEALNAYADIGRCLAAGVDDGDGDGDTDEDDDEGHSQEPLGSCSCGSGRPHRWCCRMRRSFH